MTIFENMSAAERALFKRRWRGAMTVREIAKQMGVSAGTVKHVRRELKLPRRREPISGAPATEKVQVYLTPKNRKKLTAKARGAGVTSGTMARQLVEEGL